MNPPPRPQGRRPEAPKRSANHSSPLLRRVRNAGLGQIGRALLVLPALLGIPLALRLQGYGRTQSLLATTSPRAASAGPSATLTAAGRQRAEAWALAIAQVARNLPHRPTCLPRSLTLWWVLRYLHLAPALRIGVRPPRSNGKPAIGDHQASEASTRLPSAFIAHAWIEVDGQPIGESSDVAQRYAPFEGSISDLFDAHP
ncbi:MAG: lasso peptide biosynthesis B2 protein [Acidobacteriota bacterium]